LNIATSLQSQAFPCPTQGIIFVNGCEGPKDRGEQSALGYVFYTMRMLMLLLYNKSEKNT